MQPRVFATLMLAFVISDPVSACDLTRKAAFVSVDAFVAAATCFQPSSGKNDLSSLFAVPELGQPGDPKTGKPVVATRIDAASFLWSNESHAVVFVTAK